MNSKWPKEVGEVGVYKHSTTHAGQCAIHTFGYTILGRGIGNDHLIFDAAGFAVPLEVALDEFGSIIYTDDSNFESNDDLPDDMSDE